MKKLALVLIILPLILLCGCTGYREIDRGYLASAIGISAEKGETTVYIEAASSSDVADKPSERVVLIGKGDNIQSAYKNLTSTLVKPIYFEQLGTAVFDAASDYNAHYEWLTFLKNREGTNLGMYIVKADDLKALFEFESPNGVLGYDIMGLIKMHEKENGTVASNRFYQLMRTETNLPQITLDDDKLILNSLGE